MNYIDNDLYMNDERVEVVTVVLSLLRVSSEFGDPTIRA